MSHFTVGSLVHVRGREWVVLPIDETRCAAAAAAGRH